MVNARARRYGTGGGFGLEGGLRRLAPWALALTLCACGGASSGAPPGADPTRMSVTEYDVARDLWLSKHRPREALEHALRAVELDEDNAEAAHLVALLYLDFCSRSPTECQLKQAESHARQALRARPEFREARNTLGVILIHAGQYPQAIEVLLPLSQDILYTTPENAWGNLGWAYLESGQLERAIDALKRAVAAQPLFCVGNYRLGIAYERKKQLNASLEALTRALETEHPGCKAMQAAYAARARVSIQLGRGDAARRDLAECTRLGKATNFGKECASIAQKLE